MRFKRVFFNIRPIVLSLAFSTMFNSTTFSSWRRRLRRANPPGAGEQAGAISFASAAPSNIRGRAELGLYLRLSVASNPSSTNCWRVRATLLALVSSAAEIALSLQPSPAPETSAFSRMRASSAFAPNSCRTLASVNQRFEPLALRGAQLHHVLLDLNLLLGHESPPSLLSRRQRFRKTPPIH